MFTPTTRGLVPVASAAKLPGTSLVPQSWKAGRRPWLGPSATPGPLAGRETAMRLAATIAVLLLGVFTHSAVGEPETAVRGFRLADIEWKGTPTPGIQIAPLAGDPKSGPHHGYLKLQDGVRIPPHWHSSDEYLTVLSGTIYVGTGTNVDREHTPRYGPGSFVAIPARTPHYGWAEGECIVSQTRTGAFDTHPAGEAAADSEEQ